MLRTLFLRKKYNKNIDDIYLKDEYQEPKKLSLFGIVRIYSFGTYLTLKARLVPEETTLFTPGQDHLRFLGARNFQFVAPFDANFCQSNLATQVLPFQL